MAASRSFDPAVRKPGPADDRQRFPCRKYHRDGEGFASFCPNCAPKALIELSAHTILRSRIEVGDQLLIDRHEAKKSPSRITDKAGGAHRHHPALPR
jgi:hypothetical protein